MLFPCCMEQSRCCGCAQVTFCSEHLCERIAESFVHFVTNIVAVSVCFLISLLFAVKCSHLNPWPLPIVPPVPPTAGRKEASEQQHALERLRASTKLGALNWEVPFLNHDTKLCCAYGIVSLLTEGVQDG